ncbi:DNA-directed DNA polymerase [Terrihabitans soli]|uniref:DNA-directed DNA polymerase n=1 Tax=Terrihabitans soli TaxID=708113 RepID=A0A6S6QLS9_9HYPH|nr:DNA polymerase Y family protein [Terrihabitans soli]BCJ92293.1 DNA-directed DNA polymerase [Terrihabitans soli]
MTDLLSGQLSRHRRYLALWLPWLPTDRLHRIKRRSGEPAEKPLIVLARVKSALRIAHADRKAHALGLSPGLTLADARARVPDLDLADEDAAADAALLDHIADWCDRYTPLVGMDGDDGIMLDITGCTHLFGGEAALNADLVTRLMRMGFSVRSAIAGTPDCARAVARYGEGGVVAAGCEAARVAPLPVAALGVSGDTVTALARAGLRRIKDLANRPRAPLAARFGQDLLDRLSRTLGEIDHPLSPRRPLPELAAERRFAEPIGRAEDMIAALGELAQNLAECLEARGHGGRRFEASFFRTDGAVRRIAVLAGKPLRDAKTLAKLFDEKLDALADPVDPGFGFDMIRLDALASEAAHHVQTGLDGKENETEEIAELIDRLGARFGAASIRRFVPQDSHIPERAALSVAAISDKAGSGAWAQREEGSPPMRPLRLFDPPEAVDETLSEVPDGPPIRFRWRRVVREVARAEGPERIAPEWWKRDDKSLTRDYFRVEDREGHRYWLYREGMYGQDAPRWFMHGLFA